MREIGGYIELDQYTLPMLHQDAVSLNCGRNALAYLIRAKGIRKIWIPKFLCDSVRETCEKEQLEIVSYSISSNFLPQDISLSEDAWLYVVNYYGQLSQERIQLLADQYKRVIVDNAQAYFQMPVPGVDTLYTCRKFFGVADGAFLYTDTKLEAELPLDESFDRMRFLLGRFERTASEFYSEYSANNHMFASAPVKRMSKLTENLLHAVDYRAVRATRNQNYETLHTAFLDVNRLTLCMPDGAFMYPLFVENGDRIRKQLQAKKIYIPTLWPDVFARCSPQEAEFDMAQNILPLPCDQRYGKQEIAYLIREVMQCIN